MMQVSDAQGQFRFVGLPPGTYRLDGTLDGFSPVVFEAVRVNVNRNTTLSLTMNAAVSETITITAESPLLDARKFEAGATVDKIELEKIPTARDPWVILQTTPGVLVDRVNVGGNESGQQSAYTGSGDQGLNSSWSVDGVEITDVGAIGSSPSYYDFSAFEELQVSTGGSDATPRVGGLGVNLVTKRGTNEWRGSGRYLVDKDSWQSSFSPSSGDFGDAGAWNRGNAQPSFKQGNQIVEVLDYGAELGARLGYAGHSLGGAAAVATAWHDSRVRAVANLDGRAAAAMSRPIRLAVPLLVMLNEVSPHRADWQPPGAAARIATVAGAVHSTFTDAPLLRAGAGLAPERHDGMQTLLSAADGVALTRDALVGFFACSLRGERDACERLDARLAAAASSQPPTREAPPR